MKIAAGQKRVEPQLLEVVRYAIGRDQRVEARGSEMGVGACAGSGLPSGFPLFFDALGVRPLTQSEALSSAQALCARWACTTRARALNPVDLESPRNRWVLA